MSNDYNNYPPQRNVTYGQPFYGQPYYPQPPINYSNTHPPVGGYQQPGMFPPAMPSPYMMYAGYRPPIAAPDSDGGLAIAGLVLGIISISLFWFYLGILSIPLGIVGIILSALGRRSANRRTMATVGLGLSIGGLVLALVVIAFIVLAAIIANTYRSY